METKFKKFVEFESFFWPSRPVFQGSGSSETGSNAADKSKKAPEGAEAEQASPEKLAKERDKLEQKRGQVQDLLDKYRNDPNERIKKADEDAQQRLDGLRGENLTPEAMESVLNGFRAVIEHTNESAKIAERVKKIKELNKKMLLDNQGDLKEMADAYGERAKNLSPQTAKKLNEMKAQALDEIEGRVLIGATMANINTAIDFDDFLMDRELFTKFNKTLDGEEAKSSGKDPEFSKTVTEVKDRFMAESEAVINMDVAKGAESSLTEVDNYSAKLKTSLDQYKNTGNEGEIIMWKKTIDEASQNAKALLQMLTRPEDAPKRAMVLAELKDRLTFRTNDSGDLTRVASGDISDATLRISGKARSVYEKGFDNAEIGNSDKIKAGQKELDATTYAIKGHPNFRLGLTGTQVAVLTPGTEVRVVSKTVQHVRTETGEEVNYVQVQLNPPEGAIGYIAQRYVDLSKGVKIEGVSVEAAKKEPNV